MIFLFSYLLLLMKFTERVYLELFKKMISFLCSNLNSFSDLISKSISGDETLVIISFQYKMNSRIKLNMSKKAFKKYLLVKI